MSFHCAIIQTNRTYVLYRKDLKPTTSLYWKIYIVRLVELESYSGRESPSYGYVVNKLRWTTEFSLNRLIRAPPVPGLALYPKF